jgi:hypothetical protein
MVTPTLYELTGELLDWQRALADAEGEIDDADFERFDALHTDFAAKAEAYVAVWKNLEAEAAVDAAHASGFEAEAERWRKREEHRLAIVARMKRRLTASMRALDMKTVETPQFRITRCRASRPSVRVHVDAASLPPHLRRMKVEADNAAILDAYRNGEELPTGIEITTTEYPRVS